ncbi:MAG: hypothetical protein ABIJ00_15035 [Candidatus Eisenbacteria bacterium]
MGGSEGSAGLALFLSRGMAAWIKVWQAYMSPTDVEKMSDSGRVESWQPDMELSGRLRGELITALVSMVLNNSRKGDAHERSEFESDRLTSEAGCIPLRSPIYVAAGIGK